MIKDEFRKSINADSELIPDETHFSVKSNEENGFNESYGQRKKSFVAKAENMNMVFSKEDLDNIARARA